VSKPSWTTVTLYTVGRKSPSRLTGLARENLLSDWAEGSRRYVRRVTDQDGRELTPAQIDWAGMDPLPRLRAGRPETGRGAAGRQVLVRLSPDEYEAVERAAIDVMADSVPAWIRAVVLEAAR
jgi:hypothetical protein